VAASSLGGVGRRPAVVAGNIKEDNMARYEVTRTLDLYGGIVGLDKHQAAARAQCLEQLPDGTYNIIAPVQFKAGEVIMLVKPDKATRTRLAAKKSTGKKAQETEAQETEAQETEAPKTEAPKTEAPKTEAPKTEAPNTEAPKTEAPVVAGDAV
jgi:hypothetical protein